METGQRKQRIIVSAGGTREWLDPVRYLANPSTGEMGWRIAQAALGRFAEVHFVAGTVRPEFSILSGAQVHHAETTLQMLEIMLPLLADDTVVVMAAAPMDFRCNKISTQKIKRVQEQMTLELVANPDILRTLSAEKKRRDLKGVILVGFAAETENFAANGRAKLDGKNLDMICVNEVRREEQGFGPGNTSVLLLTRSGLSREIAHAPKQTVAGEILAAVEALLPD